MLSDYQRPDGAVARDFLRAFARELPNGKTNYNATLLNKCALVKFNVISASDAATCIVGMNNKVSVGFNDNSFEYSQYGEDNIMAVGSGEKWAILLPQNDVDQTNAYAMGGIYDGTCASIPAFYENDYLTDGVAVAIGLSGGTINGLFTVNSNGDQVYLSQGNIRYAKAIANNVPGVVLLSDDWSASVYELNNTNAINSGFNSNIIDVEEWTNTLESKGAVFLPAVGYRYYCHQVYFVNEAGFYWLSTPDDPSERVYSLNFSINKVFTDGSVSMVILSASSAMRNNTIH